MTQRADLPLFLMFAVSFVVTGAARLLLMGRGATLSIGRISCGSSCSSAAAPLEIADVRHER